MSNCWRSCCRMRTVPMPLGPGASPSSGSTTTASSLTSRPPSTNGSQRSTWAYAEPIRSYVADAVGQALAEDLAALVHQRRTRLERTVVAPALVEAAGVAERREAERTHE